MSRGINAETGAFKAAIPARILIHRPTGIDQINLVDFTETATRQLIEQFEAWGFSVTVAADEIHALTANSQCAGRA